ncbi:NUMOD4 domain-containing protein [Streptomyces sp. NPDC005236]|uniref:NUMOD4 domain-containing protein n=1 Tax=Streptomyces sp. NPDC005236 TaxID=3157028 RepID=UPI0033A1B50E
MEEEWKPVPGFDGWYDVSSLGRVRSWKARGRPDRATEPTILRDQPHKKGLRYVSLRRDGNYVRQLVHRLVMLAFVGEPSEAEALVLHLNKNNNDNRLVNLEYVSPEVMSAFHLDGQVRGEDHPNAKLTEGIVRFCRRVYVPGDPRTGASALAEDFGVTPAAMHLALTGKTWQHVE